MLQEIEPNTININLLLIDWDTTVIILLKKTEVKRLQRKLMKNSYII